MIEQLNLFEPAALETKPQPIRPANPLEGRWFRPVDYYRYNENGRPSGWVRITRDYIAQIWFDDVKRKLYAGYYKETEKRYSHWGWINEADVWQYFEPTNAPEWVNNDD